MKKGGKMFEKWIRIFEQHGFDELLTHCQRGKANSTLHVKCVQVFSAMGKNSRIIIDGNNNLWELPHVFDQHGNTPDRLNHSIILHFDQNGNVKKAITNKPKMPK